MTFLVRTVVEVIVLDVVGNVAAVVGANEYASKYNLNPLNDSTEAPAKRLLNSILRPLLELLCKSLG